ncbi:hypothetical protein KC318_g1335 [Hortaea werneckii]|nr:hypothetical protein KC334_g965 [Hortaea werneckii]KAI7023803.1 hypothetical protein KC355_g1593 [Hortaea werneckii]KAI7674826.1 hypothetical protein KC318_g1335 [Hortaea werneckii]
MQSYAADQAKAAVADLMSIAKWKAPHASVVAWQAGLDEIDRFYRSAIGQSATVPQPTAKRHGSSNEYNPQLAGSHGPQSMLGLAYEKPLSLSPYKVPRPVDFELTVKQNGAPVLQQQQAAESLLQPDSSVLNPANKLSPPHASSSLDPEYKTSLPELKQNSLFTDVKTSAEPSQTQQQPPSDTVESDLLLPPVRQGKKAPSAQSQSAFPLLKSAQRDPSTPLLPKTHEWPPLQQNPQWNSAGDFTARPKWTLEPPPPSSLQPAFEGKGKAWDLEATREGSQFAIPLREKLEKGGSRSGGVSVSRDELAGGDEGRKEAFSVENEGRGVDGADEQRRLGELRANVTERDQGADVTACRREKTSDGMRFDHEDDAKGSAPDGDASPASSHAPAPDMATADDKHEREESNKRTDTSQRNDNTTTLPNLPDQPTSAAEPHTHPKVLITNPPRWSPTNSRTFSNARDEIASLKRGRENSSSTRSSSSNPAHSASSPPPPAKKAKKNPHHDQTSSKSNTSEQASEQSPPEVTHPGDRNTDSVHAPTPADQESSVNATKSNSPAGDLLSTQPTPSSPAKENQNQTHETKKRKRPPPRPTMSTRELSNLEGTTSQIQQQGQQEQVQKQQVQQVQVQKKKQKEQEKKNQKEDKANLANAVGAARKRRRREL